MVSRGRSRGREQNTVWVGGFPRDILEKELEEQFERYGEISDIRIKSGGSGPPYAFVQYKYGEDARKCITEMDKETAFGVPVKVECEGKKVRRDSRRRRSPPRKADSRRRKSRSRSPRARPGPSGNNGKFKITLENLPSDMTWIELKELGKQYVERATDVTFSRTYRNRDDAPCGILEFRLRADADFVRDKLDGRKIKGHDARLKVREGSDRY